MNKKPVLVIMAAGMGSRYGGLKQLDPIGPAGELIIDYSMYDAKRAGFETVVCIIKHSFEKEFKALMEKGAGKYLNIKYAFQNVEDVPAGFKIPEGREKPWGTAHAILCTKDLVDGPFMVINADDYYGPGVFKSLFDYLSSAEDKEKYDFCMAGFKIENTLIDGGSVSRGICVTKDNKIVHIDERKVIEKHGDKIEFTEDDGKTWTNIPLGTPTSMNAFGFTQSIFKEIENKFPTELEKIAKENPIKGEFYIPIVTSQLVDEGKADVTVLPVHDKWYGVTNKEDRITMVNAMKEKAAKGEYPEKLW